MAYTKTEWKVRKGSNLNRFEKSQETSRFVVLENAPNEIIEPGTPFSAENMNKIEEGIYEAHEAATREKQARLLGDAGTLENAKAYADTLAEIEALARTQGCAGTLAAANAYVDEAAGSHNTASGAHADMRAILNDLTELPAWDADSHTLTFTARSGETLAVDLPLEALVKGIDYDSASKEIIFIRKDGSERRIDVSDLIDVYTGFIDTHIQVEVGEGNVIRAKLLAGSIAETELAAALLAKINGKLEISASAADSEKLGGQPPDYYAVQSASDAAFQRLQTQINLLEPVNIQEIKDDLDSKANAIHGHSESSGGNIPWDNVSDKPDMFNPALKRITITVGKLTDSNIASNYYLTAAINVSADAPITSGIGETLDDILPALDRIGAVSENSGIACTGYWAVSRSSLSYLAPGGVYGTSSTMYRINIFRLITKVWRASASALGISGVNISLAPSGTTANSHISTFTHTMTATSVASINVRFL